MAPEAKSLVLELLETTEERVRHRLFVEWSQTNKDWDRIHAELEALTDIVEELRREMAQ